MNPAPAHLEAKLRFGWDFTVGQIAAMIAGILIGFAWANWISPIRGIGAAVTGVYVGGLPVAAGFIASQTEFDLWAVLSSAVRWRRVAGRFVPGAGAVAGYMLLVEDEQPGAGERQQAVLDTDLHWGDAVSTSGTRSGASANGAGGR
jgi:drug/metabolite transporter (DMT)-like permease